MYSTCIFCHARLGTNDVVEEFPVGRRLAFDPAKGRLWALCTRCRQWNLSPLETRWEALESLERLYRDTPTRYSTEKIGLARHAEGLEVVRIGKPTLPEYAAWRYGAELQRRRRRAVAVGAAGATTGALALGGVATLVAGATFSLGLVVFQLSEAHGKARRTARIEDSDGAPLLLKQRHALQAQLVMEEDFTWRLRCPYLPHQAGTGERPPVRPFRRGMRKGGLSTDPAVTLEGAAAIRAAGKILPALNRIGASRGQVRSATRFVEDAGSADGAFRKAWQTRPSGWGSRSAHSFLHALPAPVRLGLEMVTHEDTERRALEGELARLEGEWRDAEEVAAIADDLLLPDRIRRLFER